MNEPESVRTAAPTTSWRRIASDWIEGLTSWALVPVAPLGRRIDLGADRFDTPERESEGLLLLLPGIEGRSFLEQQQVLGLADAGFRGRITIVDWTSGHLRRLIDHLQDQERHDQAARDLVHRLREFHAAYPRAPIYLVGYSGGASVVLLALDELPAGEEAIVTRAVLLGAACSPEFPVASRLRRTRDGIWHFRSSFDRIVLGLGMRLFGTTDGRRTPAAGCVGFSPESRSEKDGSHPDEATGATIPFQEEACTWRWLRQFHYGGHFGHASRPWVREYVGRALKVTRSA